MSETPSETPSRTPSRTMSAPMQSPMQSRTTNDDGQGSVMAGIEIVPSELPEPIFNDIIKYVLDNKNAANTGLTISYGEALLKVYRQNPKLGQPGIMYAYVFLHADFDEAVDRDIKSQIMALKPQLLRLSSYDESLTLENAGN